MDDEVRSPEQLPWIRETLARRLDRSPPAICLLADLCRTGLLVKIEGVPL